ncbi:hypothetical protein DID76_01810 [Candidatus Marinamargulisbacteria bacterium SCGC AG-414-C22]|nr:hypothetical protein DID76_01810 [Candidatus Marinamargulisbacteria bacterium SCGC AG-414-C22]
MFTSTRLVPPHAYIQKFPISPLLELAPFKKSNGKPFFPEQATSQLNQWIQSTGNDISRTVPQSIQTIIDWVWRGIVDAPSNFYDLATIVFKTETEILEDWISSYRHEFNHKIIDDLPALIQLLIYDVNQHYITPPKNFSLLTIYPTNLYEHSFEEHMRKQTSVQETLFKKNGREAKEWFDEMHSCASHNPSRTKAL